LDGFKQASNIFFFRQKKMATKDDPINLESDDDDGDGHAPKKPRIGSSQGCMFANQDLPHVRARASHSALPPAADQP
jgi:hypothetical protein